MELNLFSNTNNAFIKKSTRRTQIRKEGDKKVQEVSGVPMGKTVARPVVIRNFDQLKAIISL